MSFLRSRLVPVNWQRFALCSPWWIDLSGRLPNRKSCRLLLTGTLVGVGMASTVQGQPIAPPHLGPRLDSVTVWGLLVGLALAIVALQGGVAWQERSAQKSISGGSAAVLIVLAVLGGGWLGIWLAGHVVLLSGTTGFILGGVAFLALPLRPQSAGWFAGLLACAVLGASCAVWLALGD